ncbi:MAG: hypothetical protein LW884_05745 [Bacteroidetes bacterium]|jgi:hypothetical protein|nr:hypothetical protein [Bacteroidota bacterium]
MKYLLVCLSLLLGAAQAQLVDVTQLTADKTTRMFSDGKNTVTGYVNAVIEAQTNCCGRDDIFLSFKTDARGYVTDVRVLAGKNDCIKQSVADIVRYIRWTPTNDEGKQTFMPVKIRVLEDCPDNRKNVYAAINPPAGWQGPATLATAESPASNTATTTAATTTATTGTGTTTTPAATTATGNTGTVATATTATTSTNTTAANTAANNTGTVATATTATTSTTATTTPKATTGATTTTAATTGTTATTTPVATTGATKTGATTTAASNTGTTATTTPKAATGAATTAAATTGTTTATTNEIAKLPAGETDQQGNFRVPTVSLPPQTYDRTVGNLEPNESHIRTVANSSGPSIPRPSYRGGEPAMGVYLRQALRKEGVCELAHVLAELTISPDGKVVDYRVFAANNEKVYNTLPGIFRGMEFSPTGISVAQYYYLEFKTEMVCSGTERTDLRNVKPYLNTPETAQNVNFINTGSATAPADE